MSQITCRQATKQDVILYLKWVNDHIVRTNSISEEPILIKEHEKWFADRILRPSTWMYVFEIENIPFGQVRFDVKNDLAIIDYSVDSNYRGRGLGSKMLRMAIEELTKKLEGTLEKLEGTVKSKNTPSIKIFERLGFILDREETIYDEEYKIFVLNNLNKKAKIYIG